MFTVTVGLDGSGKSRTRSPFASRYSVIPSTSVTFSGGVIGAGAATFAADLVAGAFAVPCAMASAGVTTSASSARIGLGNRNTGNSITERKAAERGMSATSPARASRDQRHGRRR